MTNNLKIEVLVSNIPEDGSIASQFPSQEYVNQQLAKKANLSPEGRLDPAQSPDYTEIPGLYEHIEDTKDEIGSSIASSLQDAKGYTNQQLSEGLRTKADLVNGKIPFDQIPFSADIEDQIQINVENITAVVDQKVAQVVGQVNEAATAAHAYTDAKFSENKTYVDTTVGNVIEDVTTIVDTKTVSKEFTIPTYLTPEAGVAVGTGVAAGAYFNVRSTEDDTVAIEYQNVGGSAVATKKSFPNASLVQEAVNYTTMPFKQGKGYALYERVQLTNGDIVRNIVPDNSVDPNIDKSGWVKENKIASLRDYGGQGGGANDAPNLEHAIDENNEVLLDTDQSVIRQIRVKKNITLTGHSEIKQDTSNQHTILTNYDTGTPEDLAGLMIKRQRFIGLNFGQMPAATADDFGALKIRNGDGAITAFNTFNGVENGLITAQSPSVSGVKGKGSRDTVSLCDNVDASRRYAFVNGQSNYTRVIGLTAHSNENNDAEAWGGTNNGGFNMGIRLVNWSIGFTMVASSIRDKSNGVSYQTGASHTIIANSFFENSRETTLVASTSNQPIGGRHIVSDVQIKDAGTNAIRTQYLGQSRFSGIIDTCGSRGIDGPAAETNNEHFRLVYKDGSGTVPPVGTVITQGGVTGVLVQVFKSDRLPAAAGSSMTSTGEILVKTVQGGFFGAGTLTGIGATVTRAYGAEGRNRIDATVLNATTNSLRLGTDSNLIDLISADCPTSDVNISGNFNIIRLVITDNPTTSNTIFSGSNSIIQIVDNRKVSTTGVFYITGNNNHVIGNTKARVFIEGNGNYVDIIADRITVNGNDNDVGGDSRALDGTGTGNKFNRHKKGQNTDVVTFTTNASGEYAIPHGLARVAKTFVANIIGSSELLHLTVSNVANSATTSLIKVWKADGTPASAKSVTICYLASM